MQHKSDKLREAELINYQRHAKQAWAVVALGIGFIALMIAAVWTVGKTLGESVDRRYCNTVSHQAYDDQPCPEGTNRGSL